MRPTMWGVMLGLILHPIHSFRATARMPLAASRLQLSSSRAWQPRLDESSRAAAETGTNEDSGKKLITKISLEGDALDLLTVEFNQRNKERILEGKPQYASIEAMVEEYLAFEGKEKGMSYAECEDAVLRYLQRRALLSEGADGITDPQTLLTLVLLGALIFAVVNNAFGGSIPLPNNEPPRA